MLNRTAPGELSENQFMLPEDPLISTGGQEQYVVKLIVGTKDGLNLSLRNSPGSSHGTGKGPEATAFLFGNLMKSM